MAKFEEDKYMVLPVKYLKELPITNRIQLRYISERIAQMRREEGKKDFNEYYVCNRDEVYAEKVLATILLGEERKENSNGDT